MSLDIFALGYSYSMGQTDWAHSTVPTPDSVHPYWPDRSVWQFWLTEMAEKKGFGCWIPKGPNQYQTWQMASISQIEAYLMLHSNGGPNASQNVGYFQPDVGDVLHGVFRVMQVNGPLHHDVVLTDSTQFAAGWDSSDAVTQEMHFYYYAFDFDTATMHNGDDFNNAITSSTMRIQIVGTPSQGDKKGQFKLPNDKGVDIPNYSWTGSGWSYSVTASDWTVKNWPWLATTIATVVAAIVSIFTLGTATSAVVAAEIALVAEIIVVAAEALAYSVLTGDTSGLLKAFTTILEKVVSAEINANAGDLDAQKMIATFKQDNPELYNTISNIGDTLKKVYDTASQIAQAAELDVNSVFTAVDHLGAGNFQLVTENIWESIKLHAIPPTVTYWYDKVRSIDPSNPNLFSQVSDIFDNTPDYAKDTVHLASILKAVEAKQVNVTFVSVKQVKIDRPGGGVANSSFATARSAIDTGIFRQAMPVGL